MIAELHDCLNVSGLIRSDESTARTSRRALDRERKRVIHQIAAPIGRVMRSAVPTRVPMTSHGHTNNA
jgi:hypothetical protein